MMWILPDQGVAIVSLTNVSGPGGAFNLAVQRRVVEAIFEGARPIADTRLAYIVRTRRDDIAKTMERVTREPDAAWVKGLVGAYENADLGKVTVTAGPKGGTFDAGEWKSGLGQKREVDGSVKAVLVDPPMAGMDLLIGGDDPHRTLTLLDDQVKYVFERKK